MKFLKKLGSHFLYSLVGGVVVWGVIVAVFVAISAWENRELIGVEPAFDWQHSDTADKDILIVNHRKEDADVFSVTGTIKNASNNFWSDVDLQLKVFVGDVAVNTCVNLGNFVFLEPGETEAFELHCTDTDGHAWPESMRYVISVSPFGRVAHNKSLQRTAASGGH